MFNATIIYLSEDGHEVAITDEFATFAEVRRYARNRSIKLNMTPIRASTEDGRNILLMVA